jgi:SET domain-containing protein
MSRLIFIFIILNVKSQFDECIAFSGKKFRYIEIKKSQIAGYGVYATRFIRKGTRLKAYDGDWYTLEEWDKLKKNGCNLQLIFLSSNMTF